MREQSVNSHMRIGMSCEISRCCARDKREYGWRICTVRGSYYDFFNHSNPLINNCCYTNLEIKSENKRNLLSNWKKIDEQLILFDKKISNISYNRRTLKVSSFCSALLVRSTFSLIWDLSSIIWLSNMEIETEECREADEAERKEARWMQMQRSIGQK